MSDPKVIIVAAHSENRVIGKDGGIPWRVKGDFKFWQDISRGKPVIMGRKTFLDVPPSFRKRDKIIVVTRDPDYAYEGVRVVHSLKDAFTAAYELADNEIIIGGGAEIYKQALPETDIMYLSTIHTTINDGDAIFPEFDQNEWEETSSEFFPAEKGDTCGFTLRKLIRR